MGTPKTFVIGLDAADPKLLESWIDQGKLPFFAQLMRAGTYTRLNCIPPTFSPVEWTSIMTGTNPGKHGIFGFVKIKKGTRELFNHHDRQSSTFYEILESAGQKMGLINMVMTYPATKINGFMLTGMETPDLKSPDISYPPGLIAELEAAGCHYKISSGISGLVMQGNIDGAVAAIHDAIDERYKAAKYLVNKYGCDVLIVLFSQIDNCGHYFWRFYDQSHPAYTQEEGKRYGDVMLQVYQRHEEILKEMMDEYPEANFIICSDHGMGFNYEARYYSKELFARLNWFLPAGGKADRLRLKSFLKKQVKGLYWFIYKNMPMRHKQMLAGRFPALRRRVVNSMSAVDWDNSKLYSNDEFVSIHINKTDSKGRSHFTSEAEYLDFRKQVIAKLNALQDRDTGKPLAQKVITREELYDGDYVNKAPDLIIEWADVYIRNGVQCENITIMPHEIQKNALHKILTGEHRPQGILLMKGAAFQKDCRLADGSILDIAPTVLYLHHQAIPNNIDGQVLLAAFSDSFCADNGVQYTDKGFARPVRKGFEVSAEEKNVVADRLRKLGYIE